MFLAIGTVTIAAGPPAIASTPCSKSPNPAVIPLNRQHLGQVSWIIAEASSQGGGL